MSHPLPIPRDAATPPCAAVDPEVFFPDRANLLVDLAEARRVCNHCPLETRESCWRYAIENDVHGIWAGSTYAERRQYRREHGITATPIEALSSILADPSGRRTERRSA